jgi:hypothetical protein
MTHYSLAIAFEETEVSERTAWSASVTVSSDDPDFPTKIMVFQAEDPADPNTRGWFTAIANPAQLEEYPEDAPAPAGEGETMIPFYRTDTVVLVSRNAVDLQRVIDEIREEVTLLEDNIAAIATLSESNTSE